jgi:predicted secreted hydrolase
MKREVILPLDEMPHKGQASEWWYFNGFFKSKKTGKEYSFMHCLFKANREMYGLNKIEMPFENLYFSHSVIYDLKSKKIVKEILPIVHQTQDSFPNNRLFVQYHDPLTFKERYSEISRINGSMHLKNKFLDIMMKDKNEPLFEGGEGYIDYGKKSTYYYSYPNLKINGYFLGEEIEGIAWHDHQWSKYKNSNDTWLWFSFMLNNGMRVECARYSDKYNTGVLMYPNGKQEVIYPVFEPIKNVWKGEFGIKYNLSWKVKFKDYVFITEPILKNCEMDGGLAKYWEGPVNVKGKIAGKGFMEYVAQPIKDVTFTNVIEVNFWTKYNKIQNFFNKIKR